MIMSIDQKASDIIKDTKEHVELKEAEIKKENISFLDPFMLTSLYNVVITFNRKLS